MTEKQDIEKMIGVNVLYESREYIITGRVASKKKRNGQEVLSVEIQPISIYATNPNNVNYNKWTSLSMLSWISDKRPKDIPPEGLTNE